jgi:o-succinylbenzoate synthase
MQINKIEAFHVALPLRRALSWAGGAFDTLQTVLVRIESGDLVGWGEAAPGNAPLAADEWAGSVFACVRDWFAPALVGQRIDSGEDLQKHLAHFRGNRFARAALDTAFWDLAAREKGIPLHQLLDAKQTAVEVGPTFDEMETIDQLLAAVGEAEKAGFARVGLKFRPGWDVSMVNFVRRDFPSLALHIDCEGALRLDQMEMLCRLDDFCLAMIEQPLAADDLVGHAMVQETIRTPVCLDEAITTVEQARMALELQSGKFVKIEPGRVGGITPALDIYEACHEECTPCWVGGTLQSAIGARIALELAAKDNFTYPADYVPNAEILAVDLAPAPTPSADPTDGKQRVSLSSEPGIGIVPDMEVLEKHCLARATILG